MHEKAGIEKTNSKYCTLQIKYYEQTNDLVFTYWYTMCLISENEENEKKDKSVKRRFWRFKKKRIPTRKIIIAKTIFCLFTFYLISLFFSLLLYTAIWVKSSS